MTQITLAETRQLLTSAVDWFLMTGLRNRFCLTDFVETGTAGGLTAYNAAAMFKQVWSMEIAKERFEDASRRCKDLTNVHLYHGESVKQLPDICREIEGKSALFYLDAHWCGGERQACECPLLEELEIVRRRWPRHQDVVVIDNAGLLEQPPPPPHDADEWPSIEDVLSVLDDGTVYITLTVDQIVVSPKPLHLTLDGRK